MEEVGAGRRAIVEEWQERVVYIYTYIYMYIYREREGCRLQNCIAISAAEYQFLLESQFLLHFGISSSYFGSK